MRSGLKSIQRRGETVAEALDMDAVGAGAGGKDGIVGHEQRRAGILREWGQRLHDLLARAFVGRRETQQHAGDVARAERGLQRRRERLGVGDFWRDEIEAGFDEITHGNCLKL